MGNSWMSLIGYICIAMNSQLSIISTGQGRNINGQHTFECMVCFCMTNVPCVKSYHEYGTQSDALMDMWM